MTIGPMVPLTTAATGFEARVIAAHLGSEGIVWELRGNVDGPYPVGPVVVLVAEDDLAVAREVVTEQAVDDEPLSRDEPDVRPGAEARPSRAMWVLVGVAALAVATLIGRLLVLSIP
jgi:Putative prokaryotic signal transducing protein